VSVRKEQRLPILDMALLAGLAGVLWVMPALTSEGQELVSGPVLVDRALMPADRAALARAEALALELTEAPMEIVSGR